MNLTARDRPLLRRIQRQVGQKPTGELDTATLLAIEETLAIAHKFFSRLTAAPPVKHARRVTE